MNNIMKKISCLFVALIFAAAFFLPADPPQAANNQVLSSTSLVMTSTTGSGTSTLTSGARTIPQNAMAALISIKGDDLLWHFDSTDISGNDGMVLSEGDYLWLDSKQQLEKICFYLKTGGTGVTVYVTYFDKV